MKAKDLKKSILQLAIQGKLVPQDPKDEPASKLLDKIRAAKQKLIQEGKLKKEKVESVIYKGDDNNYYEKIGQDIRNITDEIPFEIPDSWAWVRIGDISTVKGGKRVPKGYSLLDNPTSHIYIRVTNMKENTLIPDKLKYISDEIFQTIKNYVINKDDCTKKECYIAILALKLCSKMGNERAYDLLKEHQDNERINELLNKSDDDENEESCQDLFLSIGTN